MSIDVAFLSLFVRKDVLEARFPSGVAGFRERFPCHAEDNWLFRVCSMEGRDFAESLERLRQAGLEPDRDIAVAEMMGGPQRGADGIAFVATEHEDTPFPTWVAGASEELDAFQPRENLAAALPEGPPNRSKPKLELVRKKPEYGAESEEKMEPDDGHPAPARGVREVVILRQETAKCRTTEKVGLMEDGRLVVSGYDIGDLPLEVWGDDDYEYWRTIAADDVPRVLLGLIRERFASESEIHEWLDANGIESEFMSWT